MQPTRFLYVASTALLAFSVLADGPFFGQPPGENHPWAVHDWNRPQPPVVVPGERLGDPPSDAVVLFDGTEASLENWVHERPAEKREQDWFVVDGALQCMPRTGNLLSIEQFGDCQLHIEWLAPVEISGQGQGRGNSGVFFMGLVEVQVLDNYQNPTYADGMVGSVYGVRPPAVNALRPSGEWQSYDIIFRRPIVRDGVVLDPGSLTVLKNGVVVQDSTPLEGGGGWKVRKPMNRAFPDKGPLMLQDHGNPVRFRNIWYRPLPPRALDGGTDGFLSPEATLAKRAETATALRRDAGELQGLSRALRLLESLIYECDGATQSEAEEIVGAYLKTLEGRSAKQMEAEEKPIRQLERAFSYLVAYDFIPEDHRLHTRVRDIAIENGWVKRKN
jgi:hypothetical protein